MNLQDTASLQRYRAVDLQQVFLQLFLRDYNTCLLGGSDEPMYLPADEHNEQHRLMFRHDYFASALHEVAHWCIAGSRRRALLDYGYWYVPDGRNAVEQTQFEQVEARPQALECLFTAACGLRFRPSADNLGAPEADQRRFRDAIYAEVLAYGERGLPHRAEQYRRALCRLYGTPRQLDVASIAIAS